MTTSEAVHGNDSRWLVGLLAEYSELLDRLAERQRILVIEADPLSGTSAVLAAALEACELPAIAVDARAAGDASDLGLSIASAAIATHAPEASAWWNRGGRADREGLRLARTMAEQGINLELLRSGVGQRDQLRRALELIETLADGPLWLAVDHLDDLLERLRPVPRTELLGMLRAHSQLSGQVHQLLAGRTAGHLAAALEDEEHSLYRAGDRVRIRRPAPQRFVDDLAIGRSGIRAPVPTIGAAAELAAGAPAYVWRIVDATSRLEGPEPRDLASAAWRELRVQLEPAIAQQFVLAGSVHRSAPAVLAAIANGLGPYELTLNPKSVHDALTRMRARGQVFSPAKQRWAISDPALASWAREHAPLRIRRGSLYASPALGREPS
jgi:hypothetical protein